ncbi:MAG: NAD(P)-dependent oxidoreductase [Nitrosomonadales bacterium]|nr:NAD(P)-dependent oxidoreductase [Nitrosomonadales bacterium]
MITGAAGFIGRHVSAEFARRGMRVTGMGRGELGDWHLYGIDTWYPCEVTVDSLFQYADTPDVIVHCAGGASVGVSVQEPYQDFIQTVQTMAQVLEFMRLRAPHAKLVYPSSAAVYGQVKQLPISEDTPLQPISPYGTYKQIAENLCQLYAHQYQLSIAIVRLFSIYGEGLRKQLLWDACNKLANGNPEFFGTGGEVRDWLHVKDAAKLLALAADHASPIAPILNGGSGQGVCIRDVLQHLSEQLGSNVVPQFSSCEKVGDPNAFIADMTIAKQWGWSPEIDWHSGVAGYAQWFSGGRT